MLGKLGEHGFLALEVGVFRVDGAAQKRHGHRHGNSIVFALGQHFHILPGVGELRFELRCIQVPFHGQHQLLRGAQRSVAAGCRGVVGSHGHLCLRKDAAQFFGTGGKDVAHLQIAAKADVR